MVVKRGIFVFLAIVGGFFYLGNPAQAAHGDHLLISEVQITGGAGKTTHDFVEFYNPTSGPIDLNGIRLVKRTATGTADTTLKSWTEVALVPAHGYYLWANSAFTTIGVTPDAVTSGTLADNNAVALRHGAENTGEIIDAVAWGTATNALVEGAVFPQNPGVNQSMERKPGGAEGNGTDTNNNAADFFLQSTPNPKNAASAAVPAITPTPPESSPPAGEENKSVSPPAGGAANPSPPPLTLRGGEVVINEFLPDPLAGGDEWVELYNRTSATAELTGWKLQDGTTNTVKTISGFLPSQGFLVVELTSARLNNSGDRIMLRSPEGVMIDGVSYGDWNDGNTGDNAPAPTKSGQAVARRTTGVDTSSDKDDFAVTDEPTAGSGNVIAVSTVVTVGGGSAPLATVVVPNPKIVINEFVSDPEDGPEWVELYNTGEVSVDLDEWWLEDGSEAKTKLAGTLVPGHFKVVRDIAGNLNNKGDIVKLKNEKGEMIDRVTYGVWEDGTVSDNTPVAEDPYSVARRKDGIDTDNDTADFAVTAKVTKGKENVIEPAQISAEQKFQSGEALKVETAKVVETPPSSPLPNPPSLLIPLATSTPALVNTDKEETMPEVSLADLRDLELNTSVRVQGIVSAPPGILGTQVFYITTTRNPSPPPLNLRGGDIVGVQVYSSKRVFPELKLGDVVKVEGILSEAQGERRLKIKKKEDVEVLNQGKPPLAHAVDGTIGEEEEGSLVKIAGTVIDVTRSQIVIDDEADEVTIAVKQSTGIDTRKFTPGMKVAVSGIVGRSRNGYRLMPRWKEDIEVIEEPAQNFPAEASPSAPSAKPENLGGSGGSGRQPYAEATAYAGSGAALSALDLRRRKLLIGGVRALAFLIRRGKGSS